MNKRRDIIKGLGVGVAWVTPIVHSVILPTHASTTSPEMVNLSATLNGGNEVPPNNDPGTGNASMSYNSETGDFTISIITENFSNFTASHIHTGAPGVSGPSFVDLAPGYSAGNINFSGNIPETNPADLLAGNTYVNMHNTSFPAGAIRGQLTVS